MIVTCEKCKTQYALSSELVGENGRKVKCSKCTHVWHQLPLEDLTDTSKIEEAPKKLNKVPKGANLPTVNDYNVGFGLKVSFALTLILAIFLGILSQGESNSFANLVGMKETDGLVFENFKVEKQRVGNRLEFRINGIIENESEEVMEVPDIALTVLSSGGRKMGGITIEPSKRVLEAGEKIDVQTEINNVSGSADNIVLDIGDAWEMSFR